VAVGKVICKCQTGKHFVITISDDIPDVAIADIRLPPTHRDEGLQAALEIRSHHPSVGVLVLSQYVELGSR
jgi:DNA-binding NarL/FixJ family response regulator